MTRGFFVLRGRAESGGELSGSMGQCNGALARDLLLGDTDKIDG